MNNLSLDYKTLPIKRIILLRGFLGLTQNEMAELCGVSNRTYQRIEYQESDVTVSFIMTLSSKLKIDPSFFLVRIHLTNRNFLKF